MTLIAFHLTVLGLLFQEKQKQGTFPILTWHSHKILYGAISLHSDSLVGTG